MAWSETLGQVMQTRPILAYGASYLGGVIATASPCILASIPLVIGFVGGYAGGNRKQAFFYSLTFVVGLAVVMSILGAMAALMGTMFGQVGTYLYFVVAVILIVMGLQLSGIINLKMGGASQKFLPQRTGLIGALILGSAVRPGAVALRLPGAGGDPDSGRSQGRGGLRQHFALCLRLGTGDPDPGGRNLYRSDRELLAIKKRQGGHHDPKSGRRPHLLCRLLHLVPGNQEFVILRSNRESIFLLKDNIHG